MTHYPARQSNQGSRLVYFIAIWMLCLAKLAVGSWVDPDSPLQARSTKALTSGDDRQFVLVSIDARV